MSSNLEFVLEEPQSSAQGKKRPRLVTSCDHCRVKKIKCIQHPTAPSCEACHAASIPCQYRDREQYFAERARIVTGPTAALRDASPNAQPSVQLSAFNASAPSGHSSSPSTPSTPPTVIINPSAAALSRSISPGYYPFVDMNELDFGPFQDMLGAFAAHGSSQVLYVRPYYIRVIRMVETWNSFRPDPPPSMAWCPPRDPELHQSMVLQLPPIQVPVLPCPSLGLFDPVDLVQPHPKLMMDFIHVFFENLGTTYTFLCPAAICQDFLHERLSPLLANALAAGAAKYSTYPAIHNIGAANVSDVYCHMAKHLIPPEGTPATLETLHAIMLLAWSEHKRGKQEVFARYAGLSRRLATELDITPTSIHRLTQSLDNRMNCILKATLEHIELMESIIATECPHLLPECAGLWHGLSG